jgi:AraC family transcriptional regulator, regulatory protein of adaptative response / DNA-3-methyladenine glycosylase II
MARRDAAPALSVDDMEADSLYRAVASRDRRFEGRFVVAVTSTGVYCRPGCPARIPLRKNVRFYRHPAAAEAAGFRACARCRPDAAVWAGTSTTVKRALGLIDAGAIGDENVARLAERLGVGDRHLRRLFAAHVGTSPLQVAQTRRAHFARQLIDETGLPLAEVAFAAGFGSVRRFNAAMRRAFGRTPTELRDRRRALASDDAALSLSLRVRMPYAWAPLVEFLAARAIPGVESVAADVYRRTTADGGVVEVRPPAQDDGKLSARLRIPSARGLRDAVERIRRLFDVAADPGAIGESLSRDAALRAAVRACPGRRVPGGWDGLELACRAILGQQISVARATVLAGKLVAAFGKPLAAPDGALTHSFPTAAALAGAGGETIAKTLGMPRARGHAIASIARAIDDGALMLDGSLDLPALVERLCALPGIGAWTAHYLAMRLGEPDAFPAGDLWLRRALDTDEKGLLARAEAWRPFRAYAALHLWQSEVFR